MIPTSRIGRPIKIIPKTSLSAPIVLRFKIVEFTNSFEDVVPGKILRRFVFCEVRNAASILKATSADQWTEILQVLDRFRLTEADIVDAGGNKSDIAARLDEEFRKMGWREGRVDTLIKLKVAISPYRKAGETTGVSRESVVENKGYKVDNFKGRVALDVEWNAKDGNLDRDVGAYRALYEGAVIDVAVIITRTHEDLRALAIELDADSTKFKTTTTTHLGNLQPRLSRGDGGGCPILVVAICSSTR